MLMFLLSPFEYGFFVPGVGIALRLLGEAGVLQENFGQVRCALCMP